MEQMKDRANLDTKYLGGPFDRQVRIEDWNQDELKKQSVLILGVGGLGSAIALNLLRLGVGRLFFVDYDVVDLHNINRQLLYSHADVGKPKVEAALHNGQFHNAGGTQIQIFHGNALTNWGKIVQFASKSTFVYNCIDWGDKFDMAVASLCLKLALPFVMGGTFSTSLTIDYFPGTGRPCYLCTQSIIAAPQFWDRVKPQIIADLKDISFLPKNRNPIGRSSVVVCTICAEFMVGHFLNVLFLSQQKPYKASRLIFYHNTFEIVKFQLQRFLKCPYCSLPEDHLQFQRLQSQKKQAQKKQAQKKQAQKKQAQKKQAEAKQTVGKQDQKKEEIKQEKLQAKVEVNEQVVIGDQQGKKVQNAQTEVAKIENQIQAPQVSTDKVDVEVKIQTKQNNLATKQ